MDSNNLPINRNVMKKTEVQSDVDSNKSKRTINDFADAFPDWDLKPPAVVVKRVRRGI